MKKKSLFDHIKQITSVQNQIIGKPYRMRIKRLGQIIWFTDFLSMKMDWVEFVNELQKYNLKPKELYKLYTNILPKGKQWLKYIKGENQMEHPNWLINLVANDMKVSKKEAYVDAIEMYILLRVVC